MKSLLQSYLEQEIWLLIRDKWYFARVLEVEEDLLRFQHRTYNKETEEDTLWEMVVKQAEIVAIDKAKTVISRKPNVLISQLPQTDPSTNDPSL
jgi:hypothetical protein